MPRTRPVPDDYVARIIADPLTGVYENLREDMRADLVVPTIDGKGYCSIGSIDLTVKYESEWMFEEFVRRMWAEQVFGIPITEQPTSRP